MPALLGAPGSPRAWRLFELGFQPWMKRQLAGVHLAGVPEAETGRSRGDPAREPLLLVANHTSWYDGFLLREVHRMLRPDSPLRFLMLDRELHRSRYLRWIGGTGFDPRRPATLRRALGELAALREEGVVIGWFPQGRIYPATRRPLGFHSGIELAMRRLAPCRILPVAIHLEMGRRSRPSAWILAGSPQEIAPGEHPTAAELETRLHALLDRVQGHLHTHGEEAEARWPPDPTAGRGG